MVVIVNWLVGRWRTDQRFRFLVIGGWNTLFAYIAFFALYTLLQAQLHYLVIGMLAHAIAVVQAFTGHRLLTFRSRETWLREFVRFNVAQLAVLGGGLVALWVLVSVAHLDPLVGQAVVTIGCVVVSYLAHRHFSFAIR